MVGERATTSAGSNDNHVILVIRGHGASPLLPLGQILPSVRLSSDGRRGPRGRLRRRKRLHAPNGCHILSHEGELHRINRREEIGDPVHSDAYLVRKGWQLGEVDAAPGKPGGQTRELEAAN